MKETRNVNVYGWKGKHYSGIFLECFFVFFILEFLSWYNFEICYAVVVVAACIHTPHKHTCTDVTVCISGGLCVFDGNINFIKERQKNQHKSRGIIIIKKERNWKQGTRRMPQIKKQTQVNDLKVLSFVSFIKSYNAKRFYFSVFFLLFSPYHLFSHYLFHVLCFEFFFFFCVSLLNYVGLQMNARFIQI